MAVEECEQQRADVRSVDVGVRHDDDLVVAQLFQVEVFTADAAAKGRDHRPHLGVLAEPFQGAPFPR